MDIELALLARADHRGRAITGSRLPGLLALLAGDLHSGSSTARLVAELWPREQPEHPTKALQVLVTRARALLGPGIIVSTATGYRLALEADQVDAGAVLLSASAGERCLRAGDFAGALEQATAGLALCSGAIGWDAGGDDPLSMLRAARLPAFRALTRVHALALSRLDRHADAAAGLEELARQRPRDEEVLAALLRGLAMTAGPAAALARYGDYRAALRDELGGEPGPGLREVHRQLLREGEPVVRRGVRHEPNALLGREADLAAVAALLRSSRVTSIIGAGGLGKTRLAYAVSRAAEQRVVHFVALAGVSTGGEVADEVAAALGVVVPGRSSFVDASRVDVVAGIAEALGGGPVLLVLDNCEHVLPAVAALVAALVARAGELRVLTTGRAPLGLSSESVHPLPELDLATTIELFGLRARAVRPDAELPPAVVRDLCAGLEGLPLAVELAAARIRVMSAAEIARRLDDRFALLRGNSRDAPRRHRTLHAVIDWSWHLLGPAGQAAMRALSVFPGGFTLAAARQLLGDDLVVERLVEHSLLKVADDGPATRFRMLETVREFSVARRAEAGETGPVVERFLAWARDFGAGLDMSLDRDFVLDRHFVLALAEIRAEHDNLAYALRTGVERSDGVTVAATAALLGVLWLADSNLGRLAMLAEETPRPLSHFRPGPELVEATRTAAAVGALSAFLVRAPHPLRLLAVLRRLPPPAPGSLIGAVQAALDASDAGALRELGDSAQPLVAAVATYALSSALADAGDEAGALSAARRMLKLLGEDGYPWLRAVAHARIGEFCLRLEPGEEAFRQLSAALALAERLGARASAIRARWAIVLADLQRGAVDEAERGLDRLTREDGADSAGWPMFGVWARAEIRLAHGDVGGGLQLWREAADHLRDDDGAWAREVQAAAVTAHARHGRLDQIGDLVARLPSMLATSLGAATVTDFPVCGSLMLALGLADLAPEAEVDSSADADADADAGPGRSAAMADAADPIDVGTVADSVAGAAPAGGRGRVGTADNADPAGAVGRGGGRGRIETVDDVDPAGPAGAVRLVALAERFGWQRGFQPALSADWVRAVAEQAGRPAYAAAVTAYAGLDHEGLRLAGLAALQVRERVIGGVRG